ncbi:MAG: acetyl-CoA carboxylase biotin carboxyl carrier protein subunit [Deltaproteobacteria bacterium]|nr:acetyl-CoA carboxylase biotin carboxyl carrier protein subunit [Deltaproteobacteria bacterium]
MSDVTAPMAGKVIDVKVAVGDAVNEDDELIILEAMKMEMPVVSTASGTIKEIKCSKGDAVGADDVLVVIE